MELAVISICVTQVGRWGWEEGAGSGWGRKLGAPWIHEPHANQLMWMMLTPFLSGVLRTKVNHTHMKRLCT